VRARHLVVSLGLLVAHAATAQQITRDSLFDYADGYWRGRLTVSAASGDSVSITCSDATGLWGADVRFFAAVPWSPDALSTSTSNFYGFSSSSTSSRLVVMWPGNDRDRWNITFQTGRGVNWIGPATSDAAGASRSLTNLRSGWLSNGDGFLERLTKHGRVAITYPVADWFRSFEMVFTDEQRAALVAMRARCAKKFEGARPAQ
jgi:hypothetical protein